MTDQAPRILVVDDDIVLAEIICEMLESAGETVIYRTSVADAIDALSQHAGSLEALITDINMGSPMSGVELAIYVSQQWPHVAICVTSGVTPDRPKPIPLNALFLLKPCRSSDLLSFVRTAPSSRR